MWETYRQTHRVNCRSHDQERWTVKCFAQWCALTHGWLNFLTFYLKISFLQNHTTMYWQIETDLVFLCPVYPHLTRTNNYAGYCCPQDITGCQLAQWWDTCVNFPLSLMPSYTLNEISFDHCFSLHWDPHLPSMWKKIIYSSSKIP